MTKRKRWLAGILGGAIVWTTMQFGLMTAVNAAEIKPEEQRTVFTTEADLTKKGEFTASATGGTQETGATAQVSWVRDVTPKPSPDSDGTAWRVDYSRGAGSKAIIRFDHAYPANTVVHSLTPGTKTGIETKFYYSSINQEVELFGMSTDVSAWISNNKLVTIKAQNETNREWLMKDINGKTLISLKDPLYLNEKGEMDSNKLWAAWGKRWHHIYIELETLANNQLSYDVYYNGKKLNTEPIVFNISADAVNKNAKYVNRWINQVTEWSSNYLLFDDFAFQPLSDLNLRNSTVFDGQLGVDVSIKRMVLDFNTILKPETLSAVTLKNSDGEAPAGFTVKPDDLDKTKAVLEWTDALAEKTAYVLDYSGVEDVHDSAAAGSLRFTTGAAVSTEKITPYAEKHFDSQDEAGQGTVQDGVLHMELKKDPANKQVMMLNDLIFPNEIHKFRNPEDTTTMEVKLKAKSVYNVRSMFSGADANGKWWDSMIQQDQGAFQHAAAGPAYSTARSALFTENRWYHIFVVMRGNSYDYYIDGVKANLSPLPVVASENGVGKIVSDSAASGVKKFRYSHTAWDSDDESWWDDMIVQKLAALQLQASTLADGATDIPSGAQSVTLDFNTLLDTESLENIKLYDVDKNEEKEGITVSAAAEDLTKARVEIPAGVLEHGAVYELRYTGLKDCFGTTADGKLTFETQMEPADANLKTATPAAGFEADVTGFAPQFVFDQPLSAETVIPENITVTAKDTNAPAPKLTAELINSTTVKLAFVGNLMADKEYTITFGDGVKTQDGGFGIAQESRTYTFRTVTNPGYILNEFDSLVSGVGGVDRVEGAFGIDHSNPGAFAGDAARLTLGTNPNAAVIFDLGKAGDYSFDFFDVDYVPNGGKGTIYVSESADGVNFTTPVRMVVKPESDGFEQNATEVIPKQNPSFPSADGVNSLWTYSGKLSDGNRYLKLEISREGLDAEVNLWTPRIRNITLNRNTPLSGEGMISSMPVNGEENAKRNRSVVLDYDLPLYEASVTAESFAVTANGTAVGDVEVVLDNDRKRVVLTLPERMNSETQYVVMPVGVYNVCGELMNQTVSFKTEKVDLTLISSALLDADGEEAAFGAGAFTPQFILYNYTAQNQPAALAAAVYRNEMLEQIVVCDASVQPGRQVITFDEKLNVADAAGRTLKLLAWNSMTEMKPLPRESIGMVDNTYYPGFVKKAVTLSYDDGPIWSDKTMINYMTEYGVRGTFNLNSSNMQGMSTADIEGYQMTYANQEIANHTKNHSNFYETDLDTVKEDIRLGKLELEDAFNREIRGFAYPYNRPVGGTNDAATVAYLQETGHVYGRPSTVSGSFDIPQDFQNWQFTSHHTDANFAEMQERFYALPNDGEQKLFSVWGHSWEFDADANNNRPDATWETILVPFLQDMKAHENEIWNPTNIEFYDYIQAQKSLEIDETSIYNPGRVSVFVKVDGQETEIQPGIRYYPN